MVIIRGMEFPRPIRILLIEDNPAEVRLAREVFKGSSLTKDITVVSNGEDAIMFLRKTGNFSETPYPDLILLDLKLPGKTGIDVLKYVKSDESINHIPIVVLTSSRDEGDIKECYRHCANCYVVKPTNFTQFKEIVKSIEDFWFSTVQLPA